MLTTEQEFTEHVGIRRAGQRSRPQPEEIMERLEQIDELRREALEVPQPCAALAIERTDLHGLAPHSGHLVADAPESGIARETAEELSQGIDLSLWIDE